MNRRQRREIRELEAAYHGDPLAAHTVAYQIGYVVGVVVTLGAILGGLAYGVLWVFS